MYLPTLGHFRMQDGIVLLYNITREAICRHCSALMLLLWLIASERPHAIDITSLSLGVYW